MSSVQINEPSFLNTEILKELGRDGFIIMIVGCFLTLILLICCTALIYWYCKRTRPKGEGNIYPELGVIMPDSRGKRLTAVSAPYSSPTSTGHIDTMSPSAARASTVHNGHHSQTDQQINGGASNNQDADVDEENRTHHV